MTQRFSIAIVGAGPAGYFTAQALQNLQTDDRKFSIDMFERLPTPWGLVRSGVAPDHPKIKTVSKVFEKIATTEGFRLFGNIELGRDISLEDLKESYDAVVIATGSSQGKKLGIPGEDLLGSYSAAEIVPWYNGHPDFANFKVDLNSETAVVIGAGNVAMDVGRMFALDPHELNTTDTADHALAALHASSIRKTFICGRRGPEHAAFTAPELRELPKLEHTDVFLDAAAISEAQIRAEIKGEIEKDLRSNLEAMKTVAEAVKKGNARSLTFRFLSTPLEIRGDGKVEEIIFGINKVEGDTVIATGETYTIKCGIVVSAIGYEALNFDGLPYEKGRVLNNDGRVLENVYVVGWAKRGPSGVIGTNKSDASAVVDLLASDLKNPKSNPDITTRLSDKQIVDQSGWTKINAREVSEGESSGKPRRKMVDISEMILTATN
jgi:ferredoxin--NADP+ reductase